MSDPSTVVSIQCERAGDHRMQVGFRLGEQVFVDRCDPASARSRAALAKAACKALPGLDADDVEKELLAERERLFVAAPVAAPADIDDPSAKGDAELEKMPSEIVTEARSMLRAPDILNRVLVDIAAVGVAGEHLLGLTLYLMGTSRLLDGPFSGVAMGASSSGKSHTIERSASLFPSEALVLASSMSPQALVYMEPGALRHKWVVAGERSRLEDDDRAEATRPLREMLSSGKYRKAVTVKDESGRLVTKIIESDGPIAFVESTTLESLFAEDANRMLLLSSDDSEAQTRRVLTAIAERAAQPSNTVDVERVRLVHHAAQRLLRRVKVAVPFAPQLAAAMPAERPEARRAIGHALAVVRAVALLRQFQRHENPQHGTEILASLDDYAVARGVLLAPLGRSLGHAVPAHVQAFSEWLQTTVRHETFTVAELPSKDGCRWSVPTLYRFVNVLRSSMLSVAGVDGKSNRYRITGKVQTEGAGWLPEPSALEVQ